MPLVPRVEVLAQSFEGHTEQIYCGLSLLARDRRIRLRVLPADPSGFVTDGEPERLWQWHVPAILNGRTRLLFDLHDSADIDPYAAAWADLIFKRSHDPCLVHPHQHPLGLNMEIYPMRPDRFMLARMPITFSNRRQVRYAATGLGLWQRVKWRPTVEYFDSHRCEPDGGTVVFMTRAWEPQPSLSSEVARDWRSRSEFRADLIRALRHHFGRRVQAWMAPTDYAKAHFGDCVAPDYDHMAQRRYLELVRKSAVTVTTEGLFGSTGWRFAEAVALGAAIVSERPRHELPDELRPEANFLAAQTGDEFISAIERLLARPAEALAMRRSNRNYWRRSLRPDELVWKALSRCIGESSCA